MNFLWIKLSNREDNYLVLVRNKEQLIPKLEQRALCKISTMAKIDWKSRREAQTSNTSRPIKSPPVLEEAVLLSRTAHFISMSFLTL